MKTYPQLLVLTGFWPAATEAVARTLLAEDPASCLIRYETTLPGLLHRTMSHDDRSSDAIIGRAGEDTLGTLMRDIVTASPCAAAVVVLPQWCEPDRLREMWQVQATEDRINSYLFVTVVAADHLLDGLTHDDTLHSVDLHQDDTDERTIGDIVARQVEQADCVVTVGAPEGDDPWETEQISTLLHRLAPWATHRRLEDEYPRGVWHEILHRSHRNVEPIAPAVRGLRGLLVGVDEPAAPYGVSSCVFRTRRPFHPGRLEAAIGDVTDQVLRSRGHFWLASRPDLVLSWESTGTLTLGPVSGWLADLPGEHWADVDGLRQVAASLGWDPYYGDRDSHLVFIGTDLDPVRLHRILAGCLLTDAELSHGQDAWRALPDPFARLYPSALHPGRHPG